MTDTDIVVQLPLFSAAVMGPKMPRKQANLHTYWLERERLPEFVTDCAPAMRLLELLGPLAWDNLPERDLQRNWGQITISNAALIAAEIIKLDVGLPSFADLHQYLVDHPAFIWLLGFPLVPASNTPWGFNAHDSLPTARHLARMLRHLSNPALQFLLADSVRLIAAELAARNITWGECVSMDTKHIVAWVQENNPKAYVANRFDHARQPAGDPDCRLGCKRRHNRHVAPATPTRNPVPATSVKAGEYYWGYGSGIVVTAVPGSGEFILAEMTQPFDQGDLSYFFPLLRCSERRLGHKPRFGTFDAAFDAWYVYAYFSSENDVHDGFAAVPFSERGGYKAKGRQFTAEGLPLCSAGLPMPLQYAFTDRTSCLIEHQRGKYVCPLRFPQLSRKACPIHHANWPSGGCTAMMPISIGARLRYQIDRDSEMYKALYRQRTACERINSQAVALGIERPHLRSGAAIANQNTLIYTLINSRYLQRLHEGLYED